MDKQLTIHCTKGGIRVSGAGNVGSTSDALVSSKRNFMRVCEHWWNTYCGQDAIDCQTKNEQDEMLDALIKIGNWCAQDLAENAYVGDPSGNYLKTLKGLCEVCRPFMERAGELKRHGGCGTSDDSEPDSSQNKLGDTAAMRKALIDIVMLTMKVGLSIHGDVACGIIASKAKHALAKPPRQCDIGTAEEQYQRYAKFCCGHYGIANNDGGNCSKCPFAQPVCKLQWAQTPYEEKESEVKRV